MEYEQLHRVRFNKPCTTRKIEQHKPGNSKTELALITYQPYSEPPHTLNIERDTEQIPPAVLQIVPPEPVEKENATEILIMPFSSSGAEDVPLNEVTGDTYGSQGNANKRSY